MTTERLERIERAIERTTANVDDLLGAIATTDRQVQELASKGKYNERLFETLRAEAQTDRDKTRKLWNDAVTQMETDRAEAKERAEANRAEASKRADKDRAEHARRFDAQQEIIQRLLVELVEMNRDNRRRRDRVDDLGKVS